MMRPTPLIPLLTLLATSLAAPISSVEERHVLIETRQQDKNIPQLLSLASLAGIALPTDPAVLISLYPLADRLQSYLPTSSVLSVLETAAPQSFLSNVVHDPAYAMSFEEAFAKGSSPSWFLALPTDVKNYLHTYSGYGSVATAVGQLEDVTRSATHTSMTGSGGTATTTSTGSSQTSGTTSSATGDSGSTASGTGANAESTGSSTSASTGGAARPMEWFTMAMVGAAGVLGVAFLL
ncbi:MAG: hypothetical protein Q9202_000648 [Teloschistes flavicans]